MLQQMLMEDKSDTVREAVIKSLGVLMGCVDDPNKYSQVNVSSSFLFYRHYCFPPPSFAFIIYQLHLYLLVTDEERE